MGSGGNPVKSLVLYGAQNRPGHRRSHSFPQTGAQAGALIKLVLPVPGGPSSRMPSLLGKPGILRIDAATSSTSSRLQIVGVWSTSSTFR